uniref:hypothetical protein n=1 Tax=Alkalihalobacterium bogoriense TaxID=246272 RepID=UPI000550DAC3
DCLSKYTEPKIYLLPETKREELRAFDNKVKELFVQIATNIMGDNECSIDDENPEIKVSVNGSLTERQYEEMEQEFGKLREEYYSIRDQLVSEYDSFKEKILSFIKNNYSNHPWFYKNILRSIPSKEEFAYSFDLYFLKIGYVESIQEVY